MKPIVVGVDGSDSAECAVNDAARLAAATGSALHIVTAADRSKGGVAKGPGRWSAVVTELDEAESLLASYHVRFRSQVHEVSTAVVDAKPADALIDEARRLDASMIVVGNRRMHGPGRLLGSVADHVAHHAPCSVLIVKTT